MSRAVRSPSRPRPTRPWGVADVALALVVLGVAWCTAGSVTRVAPGALGTVAAVGAASYVVTVAARRLPPPSPAPLAWGLLATVASTMWVTSGPTTRWGLPTGTTVRVLGERARAGIAEVFSHTGPWPSSHGVVLLAVLATGVVAAGTASIWALERQRWTDAPRPLGALVPALALYVALAAADRRAPAPWATAVFVAAMVGFVSSAGTRSRAARTRRRFAAGATALSALCAAGAVVVTGTLGGSAVAATSASVATTPRVGPLALVDDLRGVEVAHAHAVMFTARSPVETYWQVTTLDRFDGVRWLGEPHHRRSAGGMPPVRRVAPTFSVRIALDHYVGALLPAPPASVGAYGRGVAWQGGDVRSTGRSAVRSYRVTAVQMALPGSGGVRSSQPVSGHRGAAVRSDLVLPALPQRVAALAHRIVAHAHGPSARAAALEHWFTSGRFRYSLRAAPARQHPLEAFLFGDRTGSCEDFAGAFGVLARLDGLPTRIAVGFTPGTRTGRDRYRIVGADAHVWPEVYLGARAGWVGFEPTPALGGAGPRAGTGAASTATGVPATATQPGRSLAVPGAAPGSGARGTTQPVAAPPSAGIAWGWAVVGAAVLGMTGLVAVLARRRRRRAGRSGAADPAPGPGTPAGVLGEWARVERALEGRGLGRSRAETPREHGARVSSTLVSSAAERRAGSHYAVLVELVGETCYAPGPGSAGGAARARELADATLASLGG